MVFNVLILKEKDKYNNEVTKIGRPLPVEYLIVDLPAAFAKEPIYTFNQNSSKYSKSAFPIENRNNFGEVQVIQGKNNNNLNIKNLKCFVVEKIRILVLYTII